MEPSLSPDQTVRVTWEQDHGRMSHTIEQPTVTWAATGERILAMGWDWDGTLLWDRSGNSFRVDYRRYVQGGSVSVWVDPARGVFRIGGEQGKDEPLAEIHDRLREEIDRNTEREMAEWRSRQRPPASRLMRLLAFIAYTALILLTLAAAAWVADRRVKRLRPTATPLPIIRAIPTPTQVDDDARLRELRERYAPKPGR